MKIGELAARSQTPVDTIRYYEREGLLPAPPRSEGNYRLYGAAEAERLAFIRHCRSLDMTLEEIRVLLRFRDAPAADCGDVNALLDAHIGHVAARIRELRHLERELKALRQRCASPTDSDHCGILEGLVQASSLASSQAAGRAGGAARQPHTAGSHGRRPR